MTRALRFSLGAALRAALSVTLLLVYPTICLAEASTAVYAGGAGSLFKSTDGGITWTTIGSSLGNNIWTVAIDPTNAAIIYVGGEAGVYKTVDGGAHWTAINNGIVLVDSNNWHSSVTSIVVDPTAPSTVYAATGVWGNGIFKTTNGGVNWFAINNGLTTNGSLDVRAIAIDRLHPNVLYATGVTGFVTSKTTNGGALWTALPSGGAFGFAIAVDPVQTSTIYFAGPFGMSKTTDAGATMASVPTMSWIFTESLAIDPTATAILYAGSGGHDNTTGPIYKTTDGTNWSQRAAGAGNSRDILALTVDPANHTTVYAGSQLGVFKSTDGGATWNTSLSASNIRAMAAAPITVQSMFQELIGDIQALGSGPLNGGEANALVQKLQHALEAIGGNKNPKTACNQMNAFLNQVRAFMQSGILTAVQGADLTAQAQAIMQAIPCAP